MLQLNAGTQGLYTELKKVPLAGFDGLKKLSFA
jgi:hypothetical protein